MKHPESNANRQKTIRELFSAMASQPLLAYPFYLFLVIGAGSATYKAHEYQLRQEQEQTQKRIQNILELPPVDPQSSSEPIPGESKIEGDESINISPVQEPPSPPPNSQEEADWEQEMREVFESNLKRAFKADYETLLSIEELIRQEEWKKVIHQLEWLFSSLAPLAPFLQENPLDLSGKEKALRNVQFLKKILEKSRGLIPILNRPGIQDKVRDFLSGYVRAGALFEDQIQSDYMILLHVEGTELRDAVENALEKASNSDPNLNHLEEIETILLSLELLPEELRRQFIADLKAYLRNESVTGKRRVLIVNLFKNAIERSETDIEVREQLLSDIPDLSAHEKEREIHEILHLSGRKPNQTKMKTILANLEYLKEHITREEYLRVLSDVYFRIKIFMMVISHRTPEEGTTLRDDWYFWQAFLERNMKPLFMEQTSLPPENPHLESRAPDSN